MLRRLPLAVCFSLLTACRCSRTSGEVDELVFTRCADSAAPAERTVRTQQLELTIEERLLSVKAEPGLRIIAFTGPVGAALSRADLALLTAQKPGFIVMLGGLGDDVAMAGANLAALGALHVPTLFIAGGADRLPVFSEAFDALDGGSRELMIQGTGLREVRFGKQRLVVVPGSSLGRYAIDADACGFTADDLDEIRAAIDPKQVPQGKFWLLSWAAPSGWGLSDAAGADVGSPELFAMAQALSAQGGLFAYPESQVGQVRNDPRRSGAALVVPRLGRTGASRSDGGRLPSAVQVLVLTSAGLVPGA